MSMTAAIYMTFHEWVKNQDSTPLFKGPLQDPFTCSCSTLCWWWYHMRSLLGNDLFWWTISVHLMVRVTLNVSHQKVHHLPS